MNWVDHLKGRNLPLSPPNPAGTACMVLWPYHLWFGKYVETLFSRSVESQTESSGSLTLKTKQLLIHSLYIYIWHVWSKTLREVVQKLQLSHVTRFLRRLARKEISRKWGGRPKNMPRDVPQNLLRVLSQFLQYLIRLCAWATIHMLQFDTSLSVH